MTTVSWWLLALAGALAVGDWVAVARYAKSLEYVLKPAVMLALIAVALTLHPMVEIERQWFLVALAFGLVGDVCLMLPVDAFVWGLSAFLLGHVAYIIGFLAAPSDVRGRITAVLLVAGLLAVAMVAAGREILGGLKQAHPRLVGPVMVYALALSTMAGFAGASGSYLALVGGANFFWSDVQVAFMRFGRPRPFRVQVIAVYHCAQALLVVSLAAGLPAALHH